MSVLRKKGYEGSSLVELAESAGLKKASLYHRFPGGKREITEAVLTFADDWVKSNIYDLLTNKSIKVEVRLDMVIKTIAEDLYDNGHEMCLLRALSMDSGSGLFGDKIKNSMAMWINAFTQLGRDFEFDNEIASSKAVQALVNIQGGLVVSESLGSTSPFQSILLTIKKLYLKD